MPNLVLKVDKWMDVNRQSDSERNCTALRDDNEWHFEFKSYFLHSSNLHTYILLICTTETLIPTLDINHYKRRVIGCFSIVAILNITLTLTKRP